MGGLLHVAKKVLDPFDIFGKEGLIAGGKDPVKAANPYLQQIPQHGQQAFQPFINQGQNADQILGGEYANLLQNRPDYSQQGNDPVGYLNQLLGQYQPSAGFGYRKNQLTKGAAADAAAGGFRGTQGDIQNQAELVNALMGGDMQQFLANVLGIQEYGQAGQERQHGAGLQGFQGIADRGFNAGGSLADFLGNNLGQQAGLQFQGQNQRNANRQGLANAGIGAAAGGVGNFLGQRNAGQNNFQPLNGINFGGQNGNVGNFAFNANRGGYGAQGGRGYGVN